MALYLISYDIADKDAFESDKLWAKLDEMGAVKILYSEYLITGGVNEAESIYNEVAPLTLQQDRLWVQELASNAYWDNLRISDADFKKWLAHARC
jgi:hypothetical protein